MSSVNIGTSGVSVIVKDATITKISKSTAEILRSSSIIICSIRLQRAEITDVNAFKFIRLYSRLLTISGVFAGTVI